MVVGSYVNNKPIPAANARHAPATGMRRAFTVQSTGNLMRSSCRVVHDRRQHTVTRLRTSRLGAKSVDNVDVVFVAGASGRLGSRIVKQCLLAGCIVRAGVRSKEKGQDLINMVKESGADVKNLQLEVFDLFDEDTIAPALGNAETVISAIGAPEDKPFDVDLPRKIDGEASIRLIEVAASQQVKYFILVTSLGVTEFGLPASLLNLFWGVLYWKKQAEEALVKSGMIYTIVRPGGMEIPQDDYKETHNTYLSEKDTMFGGQVSRLQVAELVATCVGNSAIAANKTLEIIADDTVPLVPLVDQLKEQPVEITVEAAQEAKAKIEDARSRSESLELEMEALKLELAQAEEEIASAEDACVQARVSLQNTTALV